MNNIGIIGTESYADTRKITNLFMAIKNKFGTFATIMTGGNNNGVESISKKYALELGLNYKEFNPSYTGWNIYSAEDKNYYGKGYHMSHLYHRYKQLINTCTFLFIFIEKGHTVSKELKYAMDYAKKIGITTIIID